MTNATVINADDIHTLASLNIEVKSRYSSKSNSNIISVQGDLKPLKSKLAVTFDGDSNRLTIGEESGLCGHIWFDGSDSSVEIGGRQHIVRLQGQIYSNSTMVWGVGSRTYGTKVWAHGGRTLQVGADCLFSENISIRTSDHHSIIDLSTNEQINYPADVVIGQHVWIGSDCQIMKGSRIGDGAILATGAITSSVIPPKELWAGVPARCVRQNVSWVDSHPAEIDQVEALIGLFGR